MQTKNGKPKRFAALCRVSGEEQEKEGSSLEDQKEKLAADIKSLGGLIANDDIDYYAGQEHATPDWREEREILEQLLCDAESRKFEAVIVYDLTRWSRDNETSKRNFRRLKEAGVEFYVRTMKQDLYDPRHTVMLGVHAEFAEFQAALQKLKSVEGNIKNLKDNKPITNPPYGRTWSKKAGWGIDPDKKRIMEEVAEAYLAGESFKRLGKRFGLDPSGICKNLHYCGDKVEQTIKAPDLNIEFTATLKIPRLLDDDVIRKVEERMKANRRMGKPPVHGYLLRGHIFCAHCNRALTAQTTEGKWQYYRHARNDCPHLSGIRASDIEESVVRQLIATLGNPAQLESAMKAAIPNCDAVLKQKKRHEAGLKRIAKGRKRILNLIVKGTLSDAQATETLDDLSEREEVLKHEVDKLNAALADIPEPDRMQELVKAAKWYLGQVDAADRRKLIEMAFSRKGDGVYVKLERQPYQRTRQPDFEIKCSLLPRVRWDDRSRGWPMPARSGGCSL
jgi:DNA invertase Pin-like site-specific DNA recombinase